MRGAVATRTLDVLSEEEVLRIHATSLDILEHDGIVIHHDAALRNLHMVGASVDHTRQLVRISPDLVNECIKRIPKSHVLAGRTKKNDLVIQPSKTYARCASGSIYVIDPETGERREATSQDVRDFARIQDGMENIALCGGSPYPCDVHPNLRDVYQIKIILESTEKHIRFQPLSAEGLRFIVELATAVVGSEEDLGRRPIVSCIMAPVSPLVYSEEQVKILIESGRRGLPVMLGSTPTVGATGPVTLAGSLILQNAEILGGVVLSQVMNPGAPLSYGPRMPVMDMRTGLSSWGPVEFGLAAAAGAQIGRHYRMETDLYGTTTDAKVLDEQAGIERTVNALLPALAGASIVNGAGVLESILTVSIQQLVIDNELLGMMFRTLRGIKIDEETAAREIISRVGAGGNFLTEDHTKKHYTEEHFIPRIFDRKPRSIWERTGRRDVASVSKELATRILSQHEPRPLDGDTLSRIQLILKDAERSLTG